LVVVKKNFEGILDGSIQVPSDLKEYSDKYYSNFTLIEPDYMKSKMLRADTGFVSRYAKADRLSYLYKLIKYWRTYKYEFFYCWMFDSPYRIHLATIKRHFMRKVRLKKIDKFFQRKNSSDRYYLYPLHFHPEASTSVLAKYYIDEYNVISNVANSIPYGSVLYVKDHISAAGFPTMEFYNKLNRLPNVRLIHYNENPKDLIKEAIAVITITSTMGYEALVLNKPVYILGNVFYEFHPNCYKISHYRELFAILKQHENIQVDNQPEAFICAYALTAYDGIANYKRAFIDTNLLKHSLNYIDSLSKSKM
jgi:capsule polysaccharide modification protein KpsS